MNKAAEILEESQQEIKKIINYPTFSLKLKKIETFKDAGKDPKVWFIGIDEKSESYKRLLKVGDTLIRKAEEAGIISKEQKGYSKYRHNTKDVEGFGELRFAVPHLTFLRSVIIFITFRELEEETDTKMVRVKLKQLRLLKLLKLLTPL